MSPGPALRAEVCRRAGTPISGGTGLWWQRAGGSQALARGAEGGVGTRLPAGWGCVFSLVPVLLSLYGLLSSSQRPRPRSQARAMCPQHPEQPLPDPSCLGEITALQPTGARRLKASLLSFQRAPAAQDARPFRRRRPRFTHEADAARQVHRSPLSGGDGSGRHKAWGGNPVTVRAQSSG